MLVALMLGGCAGLPELASLQKAAPGSALEATLHEDLSYKFKAPYNRESEVGVLAGRYVVVRENALGKFYAATTPSLWWRQGKSVVIKAFVLSEPPKP